MNVNFNNWDTVNDNNFYIKEKIKKKYPYFYKFLLNHNVLDDFTYHLKDNLLGFNELEYLDLLPVDDWIEYCCKYDNTEEGVKFWIKLSVEWTFSKENLLTDSQQNENINNSRYKIKNIVDNQLKKSIGGKNYFNNIDNSLKVYKNVDLIKDIILKIKKDTNNNFNLILTGGFGDWVLTLIKKGIINIPKSLILVNGSIRGKNNKLNKFTYGKEVNIEYQFGDIYHKKFILFDDSFYSGSTKNAIDKFLKKLNSEIIKTYVVYDGNDTIDNNRISLYRYYNYNNGTQLSINKLLGYLYTYHEKYPINTIEQKIIKGQITTIREIKKELNKIYNNIKINDFNRKDELKLENLGVISSGINKNLNINQNDNNNDISKKEILFSPSGEIKIITLYEFGVIVGINMTTNNKIMKFDKTINYWIVNDKDKYEFMKILNNIIY